MHHLLAVCASPTASSNNADDTPFTVGDLKALYLESQLDNPDIDSEAGPEDTISRSRSEGLTPQEVGSEGTTAGSEDTAPQEVEPEGTVAGSEDIAPQELGPEGTTAGSEDIAPQARSEDIEPEDTLTGSEGVVPQDVGPNSNTP